MQWSLSPTAEAEDLSPSQCRFESDRDYALVVELGIHVWFRPICFGVQVRILSSVLLHLEDTSHWTRRGHNKGKISPQRLSADEILIIIPQDSYRIRRSMLLRSLLEKGMEYRCRGCSNDGYWKDKELCLEINHINGNWYDNTFENLEFLCPNCHSQEPTSHTRKNVAALT
jgi:5-methylcytosine-specific restriction endonuclease McrA